MLEIRNITKVYRSKAGMNVKALDDVSIRFPETGMVFLLGKSGSGKSTLLNVIGGLDSCDSGEFIIMGKSSKDFAGSDFDAYRNTFLGFIFQEYNILDDFTVGANIGLALQLQGKKATNEAIEAILEEVDLVGYAHRKPNELSGGQKQRVAIARALVKDPQIIMADEPTGALDSNTGKQVFDTLKNLSRTKLVLIVSHDRDFAERYADRIIELSDGRIVSDVTKHEHAGKDINEGIQQMGEHILRIRGGYALTASDVEMINRYLATHKTDLVLSGDARVNAEMRNAAGLSEDGATTVFEETDEKKDVTVKSYDGKKTKFIRSRLPMNNAVKIGASGLKHKKFRLVMTILLSLIAFGLFGLSDTMASYKKITAATESILDSKVSNASFTLGVKETTTYTARGKSETVISYTGAAFNDQDIASLREKTGLDVVPVFTGSLGGSGGVSVSSLMKDSSTDTAYTQRIGGFVNMSAESVQKAGLTVTGRLPSAPGEIAVTQHLFEQFNLYGFANAEHGENVNAKALNTNEGDLNSILGKHITFQGREFPRSDGENYDYVIVGVVDTHFDKERFADFLPQDSNVQKETNWLKNSLLLSELQSALTYGFHTLAFVTESDMQAMAANANLSAYRDIGVDAAINIRISAGDDGSGYYLYRLGDSALLSQMRVTWLDGTARTTLGSTEYVVSQSVYNELLNNVGVPMDVGAMTVEEFAAKLGITDYDTAPSEAKNRFESYYNGAAGSDFQLRRRDMQQALCAYIAYCDVYASDLWQNASLVKLAQQWSGNSEENWATLDEDTQKYFVAEVYTYYLNGSSFDGRTLSIESAHRPDETNVRIFNIFRALAEEAGIRMTVSESDWRSGEEQVFKIYSDWTLVGYFDDSNGKENTGLIFSDVLLADSESAREAYGAGYSSKTETVEHENGKWTFAVAPMPTTEAGVRKLVELSYDKTGDFQFAMQNHIMDTLEVFNEFIEIGAKVFLWIGVGFAVFASLLLMNFISISISYKKREIGILRAVGARSSDVFKIFFSEAFIIALINFFLANVATVTAVVFINRYMRGQGIQVTLLTFGIRQIGLMLLISIAVAAIASFLPVFKIARKKPVDAIKNL